MFVSGVAAFLRVLPWAAPAALAIALGVVLAMYYARGRTIDALDKLSKTQAETIAGLQVGLKEANDRFDQERQFRDALTTSLQALKAKQAAISKEIADALKDEPIRPNCALNPATTRRLRAGWADRARAAENAMQDPRRIED